ncbi:hypothetical protein A9P82_11550 [Arachidicoccus ginsenosidimutans]|uniref:hypothetical protein n=1 Tax=Arachidicoccus sp. BS20 TaxID=1850526 RepID=UPI0007F05AAB|nr:hypothetical protein [Arachidicoccus sp. BS20]ANI89865.1 hypothetical protein A9P82_11550 [Arachidicoccus sp. BS20]
MKNVLFLLAFLFFDRSVQAQDTTDSIPLNSDSVLIQDVQNNMLDNLPTLAIDNDDLNDNGGSSISSMLTAGRNPFLSAASFNFSVMRFKIRGYENSRNATYINGLEFNGLDNGNTPFGLWSGMSSMMRARENVQGLQPANFGFGSFGMNTNIDMRSGKQWRETNLGYAFSNRNYQHRLNFSHSSGFGKTGWAYSIAAFASLAGEGYVAGTYNNSFSFYGALDKKIGLKNTVSFIGFYAPSEYGRQAASVQEAMDLAGTNFYNPSWGYQNGKKRNANVNKSRQPVFILSHEFKPDNHSNLQTSVGYFWGKRSSSALDWNNAPDPRPDYYRYLPSYYAQSDPAQAQALTEAIKNSPDLLQINWQNLYNINRSSYTDSGLQSRYILGDRVVDTRHLMASINFTSRFSDMISVNAGANFGWQKNHYYQQVDDLLGGDFWLNVNQYALRDFPTDNSKIQYDLDHPNAPKKAGGHYGYDYDFTYRKMAVWWQTKINLNRFDIFWASEISYSQFYRTGNVRTGLFPNASLGKSAPQKFVNNAQKLGLTYKLNGRNYFFANAGYFTIAPFADNAYLSPRTRNSLQNDIKSESVETVEGGYSLNSPFIRAHIGGYFTKSQNGMDVISFYSDDAQAFANYALNGINRLYFGGEFGSEIKLTQTLNLSAAAAVGRYYYDSRQNATLTIDNTGEVSATEIVYLKNYRIPSTPQNAYSLGLRYNSPKYWYAALTGNYMNNDWLSTDPQRHTASAVADVNPQTDAAALQAMLAQEKLKGVFTLDFMAGWNKRLRHVFIDRKPVSLVLGMGVNNLTDNKNIRSGGYEQLRNDPNVVQNFNNGITKFPPKYYYAFGLNYYLSIAFRF